MAAIFYETMQTLFSLSFHIKRCLAERTNRALAPHVVSRYRPSLQPTGSHRFTYESNPQNTAPLFSGPFVAMFVYCVESIYCTCTDCNLFESSKVRVRHDV